MILTEEDLCEVFADAAAKGTGEFFSGRRELPLVGETFDIDKLLQVATRHFARRVEATDGTSTREVTKDGTSARAATRRRKLTAHDAAVIRTRLARGETGRALGRAFGVPHITIQRIAAGESHKIRPEQAAPRPAMGATNGTGCDGAGTGT